MTHDVDTAEHRIHELSHELRARREVMGPGPTPAWRWVALGLAISIPAAGVLGALTAWSARPRPPKPAVAVTVPASAEPHPSLSGAQWYPQAGVAPLLVDTDGDGTEDILGLVWKTGDDERALHVAAWDGKSFDLRWSAGPFPSQWSSMSTHLVTIGRTVVVTDTRENVHLLDLATGALRGTANLPRGAQTACAVDNRHALFDAGTANARVLDTVSNAVSPAPKGTVCRPAPVFGATRVDDGARNAPPVKMPGFHGSFSSLAEKVEMGGSEVDLRVTSAGVERDGAFFTYAAGWDGKTKRLLWEHRLASDGHAESRLGTTRIEVGGGRVYHLYAKEGAFAGYQLTARSTKTGEELWSEPIQRTDQGTSVSTLHVERDRVYVVTNQLSIFDAEHGFPVRTLP